MNCEYMDAKVMLMSLLKESANCKLGHCVVIMFAPRPPGAPPRRRDKRGDLSTSTGGSDDAVQSTNDDAQVSKLCDRA